MSAAASRLHGNDTVNPAGVAALAGTRATGLGGELEVDSAAALTDAAVVMNGARGIAFGSGAVNPVFGSLSGGGNFALTTTAGVSAGTLTVGGLNANTTYTGVIGGGGAGQGGQRRAGGSPRTTRISAAPRSALETLVLNPGGTINNGPSVVGTGTLTINPGGTA